MEENKDQNKNINEIIDKDAPVAPVIDEEESVASAEDIAAYEREAAERRKKQKTKKVEDEEVEISKEFEGAEANMPDPYLEPDPTLPKVPFKESIYLSRGCSKCPTSYVPIKEQELRSCCKVGASNWMKGIRRPCESLFDIVEVRFKNNRKEFYRLPEGIDVSEGDLVAVEGMPGHDVGIVSLIGEACRIQMKKKKVSPDSENIKKLFRRAKSTDIEKWVEALQEEKEALIKTRRISEELGLVMKVNDVEFQGDRSKAIFYYTADDRVDFRSLIKVLAEEFKVRVEMKQIGVRQEAGKVGGIGTCGRELCCSTWLTNFKSVTTGVAKAQQILPNPQKLAGQCGKLKCCLNFEYEVYVDALKKFPPAHTPIRFKKGLALYKKTDVFRGIMWYAYEGDNELYAIPAESVKEIIEMNHNQEYPEKLEDFQVELMSSSALAQETSSSEFERELSRMADSGVDVSEMDNRRNVSERRRIERPRTNEQRVEFLNRQQSAQQMVSGQQGDMENETRHNNRNRKTDNRGDRRNRDNNRDNRNRDRNNPEARNENGEQRRERQDHHNGENRNNRNGDRRNNHRNDRRNNDRRNQQPQNDKPKEN